MTVNYFLSMVTICDVVPRNPSKIRVNRYTPAKTRIIENIFSISWLRMYIAYAAVKHMKANATPSILMEVFRATDPAVSFCVEKATSSTTTPKTMLIFPVPA